MPLMHYRLPYVGIDLSYLVLQPDTSLAYTARPWIRASVSRDVPQLLLGTHFTYPLMDGSGWAGWVPGSALRSFTRPKTVTHPGTNQAWGAWFQPAAFQPLPSGLQAYRGFVQPLWPNYQSACQPTQRFYRGAFYADYKNGVGQNGGHNWGFACLFW